MNASVTRKSGRHGRVVAISEWSPLQVLLYWFADTWSPQHTPLCITFKELHPICIACATWGRQWCRKRIRFHTDNEAATAVKSGTSHCPNVMSLLRQLSFICAKGNFMVTARYIPGTTNILADALFPARFQAIPYVPPYRRSYAHSSACSSVHLWGDFGRALHCRVTEVHMQTAMKAGSTGLGKALIRQTGSTGLG